MEDIKAENQVLKQMIQRQADMISEGFQFNFQITARHGESATSESSNQGRAESNGADNSPAMPEYKMSQSLNTVNDLWREWNHGLNGGPSVRSLEDQFKGAWRGGHRSSES